MCLLCANLKSATMKTMKFIIYFNLFFYTSIIFTVFFASLVVYQIEINSLKLILIKFFNAFPVIFGVVNITLVLILVFEGFSKWWASQLKNVNYTSIKRDKQITSNKLSLSNN